MTSFNGTVVSTRVQIVLEHQSQTAFIPVRLQGTVAVTFKHSQAHPHVTHTLSATQGVRVSPLTETPPRTPPELQDSLHRWMEVVLTARGLASPSTATTRHPVVATTPAADHLSLPPSEAVAVLQGELLASARIMRGPQSRNSRHWNITKDMMFHYHEDPGSLRGISSILSAPQVGCQLTSSPVSS